jgi:hypothetical protein
VLCEYVDLTLPTVLGVADAYAGSRSAAPAAYAEVESTASPAGVPEPGGPDRLAVTGVNGGRP